jgi:hypothetical protein
MGKTFKIQKNTKYERKKLEDQVALELFGETLADPWAPFPRDERDRQDMMRQAVYEKIDGKLRSKGNKMKSYTPNQNLKFEADKSDRCLGTTKLAKEIARNANRSYKKSVRRKAKEEIIKELQEIKD